MTAADIEQEIGHQKTLFRLSLAKINGPTDGPAIEKAAQFALILGELRVQLTEQRRRNSPMADWTDDRIETLTKLWNAGQSAAFIAEQLGGVTRNGVIGKAHRMGLKSHPKAPK